MTSFSLACTYFLDLLLGDPEKVTHPVIFQGMLITFLERKLNQAYFSAPILKLLGACVVLVTVSLAYSLTWFLIFLANQVHPWFGFAISIWFASTTIAQHGLHRAAQPIAQALESGELEQARRLTGEIVGRQTSSLSEHELVRASIETVAENTVDAITSPLFFAALGGAPLAMAYRATNTLDSMLGYKNERYLNFGWAAARFDDFVNYLPARLTALLLPLAAWLLNLDVAGTIRCLRNDARKHASPNSGWTEAGFAGALKITLGGENVYAGRVSQAPLVGEVRRPLVAADILAALRLMTVLSGLFALFCILLLLIVR